MPLKGQPRRRQPARGNRTAALDNESTEVLSAPSQKQNVVEDNGDPDIPMEVDHQEAPYIESRELAAPEPRSEEPPSSAPTALADSPPPRRSVQRLTSVLPRGSPNPTAADGPDNRPALKYKPKSFIRRSKEEREVVERAEIERQAARLAAERGSERVGHHSRGRGGYGEMNRWKNERFNLSHEASGHLGGATIGEKSARGRGRGGYGGRGGGGGGGGSGGGTGRGAADARLGALEPSEPTSSLNPNKGVKKEPAAKPEKDRDGSMIMASSKSKSKPKKTKIKKEDQAPAYVSSEGEFDSEGGKKVDIERINLVTSSEDSGDGLLIRSGVSKGKQRQRTPHIPYNTLRPVRIQRQEHVKRAVGVNTDASSLTSAELRRRAKERAEAGGTLFMSEDEAEIIATPKVKHRRKPKEVEFVRDERKWKGVYQDDDGKEGIVKVKEEPKDDNDIMVVDTDKSKDIDKATVVNTETPMLNREPEAMNFDEEEAGVPLHTATQEALPGAEETLKVIHDVEESGDPPEDETLPQSEKIHARLGHYLRRKNLSSEERHQLLTELNEIWAIEHGDEPQSSASKPAPATNTHDDEDDEVIENVHESVFMDGAEDRLAYVFQLPPIIPSVRDISKKANPLKSEDKKEDKRKGKAVIIEVPKSNSSVNPFHVKEEPDVKPDRDALASDNAIPNAYIAGGLNHPGGCAGVFNIHARGQMRAYWGGMSLDISKGGGGENVNQELLMTNYASEMVKIESEEDNRWEEKVNIGQKGWTMGQTQAGYKCVPEWGSLLT